VVTAILQPSCRALGRGCVPFEWLGRLTLFSDPAKMSNQ